MKYLRPWALWLMLSGGFLSFAQPLHAFNVVASTSSLATPPAAGWATVVIDTVTHFAYFASTETHGTMTRMDMGDLSQSELASPFFTSPFSAGVIDSNGGYAYFMTNTSPLRIVKVRLSIFAVWDFATLAVGLNSAGTAVIDPANGFMYIGTKTTPGQIVKVRLSDLATIGTLSVAAAASFTASFIDEANGFAYFGSNTTPGYIAKIRLSDFTLNDSLTLNSTQGAIGAMVLDSANNTGYVGTLDSPGKVARINMAAFSVSGSHTLASGGGILSAGLSTLDGMVVFGTNDAPAKIARIRTSNLTEPPALTLSTGQNSAAAMAVTPGAFAFVGLLTNPAQMVVVDLNTGAPTIQVQPQDNTVRPGQSATFSVTVTARNPTFQWLRDGTTITGATASSYDLLNVALTDDSSSFWCVVTNSSGSIASSSGFLTVVPVVRVFPNPWRIDRHTGSSITFDRLANNSTIKLFTVSAHWIKTIPGATGTATWDLTNDVGQRVASGYYFYLIETPNERQTVRGKLAIIK